MRCLSMALFSDDDNNDNFKNNDNKNNCDNKLFCMGPQLKLKVL